ncbi:hypothetical protein [Lentibacillus sp. CBA3610]|uniref:hypothetical protein n=1 Tax=Lentibacillus sp. CBA3610 TaxID=2518176 RepID=UPI0015951A6F|nr:hypothetical protein [Lentibacillus sp. CBA3610]QKY68295.1 hypothetical protein Len3610_00455 [Lentibacillus sp. CBA3610]
MIINTIMAEHKEGLFNCYYPKYYAEWFIKFRTLFGIRREKILTLGDGVTNHSSIIDTVPVCESKEVKNEELIAYKIDENEFYKSSFEALKKYFIYRRRSWKIPELKCTNISKVYIPYQIENKRQTFGKKEVSYLYEPSSQSYDKLKNYVIIQSFYRERGDIS